MKRIRYLLFLCVLAAIMIVFPTIVAAGTYTHYVLDGTNWYSCTDTVQDDDAYYGMTISSDVQKINANRLHFVQARSSATVTRGDPRWGYHYIVDNVYGVSYRYDTLFGLHLTDYAYVQFENNQDVLSDTNYYPYTETWHYSNWLVSPYTTSAIFVP